MPEGAPGKTVFGASEASAQILAVPIGNPRPFFEKKRIRDLKKQAKDAILTILIDEYVALSAKVMRLGVQGNKLQQKIEI